MTLYADNEGLRKDMRGFFRPLEEIYSPTIHEPKQKDFPIEEKGLVEKTARINIVTDGLKFL